MRKSIHSFRRVAMHGPGASRRAVRGVGLIEVLVAVAILAFGMLAIAALQSVALRNSQSALERSQAVMQTYAILDAMRANRAVATIGGYDLTSMTCAPPTGGNLATNDLRDWINSLHASMGSTACGQIKCGSLSCEVSVRWNDARGSGGSRAQTVTTRTRL